MRAPAFVRVGRAAGIVALLVTGGMVVVDRIPVERASTRVAQLKSDFSAVARYVFIPSRIVPLVTVVEKDSDEVVGILDAGLVSEQTVVSEATGKLVAVDGMARSVSLVD